MVANPKYDTSVDEFSFGIVIIHIFSGQWPEPGCSQIRMEASTMIPVTEAERRKSFLKVIGDDHPLREAIISCIHNDPSKRMHASEIVEHNMSKMVEQFQRKHSDSPTILISAVDSPTTSRHTIQQDSVNPSHCITAKVMLNINTESRFG